MRGWTVTPNFLNINLMLLNPLYTCFSMHYNVIIYVDAFIWKEEGDDNNENEKTIYG